MNGNFTDLVNSNVTVSPARRGRPQSEAMDSLKRIVGRIEKRLKALDMKAATASRKAGLSASAIRNMQRGAKGEIATKGANATTLSALAPALKTSTAWLMNGEGPEAVATDPHIESSAILRETGRRGRFVRLVGYVGAGSEAHYYAIAQEDFEEVEAPPFSSDQTVAVEIRGKSFGPLLDSWLVFYDDVRSPITDDMLNQTCVVGLADDRILVKHIRRERDGSYTLISNSNEPPIRKAQIEWGARVIGMRPRR